MELKRDAAIERKCLALIFGYFEKNFKKLKISKFFKISFNLGAYLCSIIQTDKQTN